MKCPICEVELVMSERQGVEIDYCPKCRGVWLDRGELDKIIEKSTSGVGADSYANRQPQPQVRVSNDYQQNGYDNHDNHDSHNNYNNGHKKKGMLGELFDF